MTAKRLEGLRNGWKGYEKRVLEGTCFQCQWKYVTSTLFFLYKNVVFPAQAEYSYFSADFRLKIYLYYS